MQGNNKERFPEFDKPTQNTNVPPQIPSYEEVKAAYSSVDWDSYREELSEWLKQNQSCSEEERRNKVSELQKKHSNGPPIY